MSKWHKSSSKRTNCQISLTQKEIMVDDKKETVIASAEEKTVKESDKHVGNLSLCINVAKKDGKGEDSDPIAYVSENVAIVGVFDGMGGSGATEYSTANGTHTGAYIASRTVKNACLEYVRNKENAEVNIPELTTLIKKKLDESLETNGIKSSGLRSAIIRILPTTLAIVRAQKDENQTRVMSYWCGDSRNYILTKLGLKQVSIDHLSKPQDPLENLRNDESLSNCVCQDKPFSIETYNCGVYTEPVIILSATDGCFGYLRSPMHFEYLLLKTLVESNSKEEWKTKIEEWLKPISGDDFSIGLVIVDKDFEFWKDIMKERLDYLENSIINPIRRLEEEIEKAKRHVEDAQSALYDGITGFWETYKPDFMPNKEETK